MLRRTHAIFAAALAVFFGLSFSGIIATAFFGIVSDFDRIVGIRHRTFTHSILFVGILYVFMDLFYKNLAFPALIGVSSHIFADMLNPSGVELAYPFKKKRYKIANFKYDSFEGNGIILIISFVLILVKLYGIKLKF